MTLDIATIPRRRRTPDEARNEAIASARKLLLRDGPTAMTVSAVAADIGVTHGNLLHHFGSVSGLHSALMGRMVSDLSEAIEDAVVKLRTDEGAPLEVINAVFDAFGEGGAGRLAAWIALSGQLDQLAPVRTAVRRLVEAIREKLNLEEEARASIASAVLFVALTAFGETLIGPPLRDMLKQPPDAGRRLVAQLLPSLLVHTGPPRPPAIRISTEEVLRRLAGQSAAGDDALASDPGLGLTADPFARAATQGQRIVSVAQVPGEDGADDLLIQLSAPKAPD